MEKITQLNTKAWYRALKVIYILFVLICYSIAIGGAVVHTTYIFDSQRDYRRQQMDVEIRLQKIQELKNSGQTTNQIIDNLAGEFKKYGMTQVTLEEYKKIYGEKETLRAEQIYDTKIEPEKPKSYMWLILYIPLYLLLAFILSEIPKRIFYYVYLGTLKPEK